jgi:hypothetical protein
MNIQENNKLLAEFMELKPILISTDFYGIQKDHVHITGKNTDFVMFEFSKSAKYHSDWNWLMQVVDKIESLEYNFNITSKSATVLMNHGAIFQTLIYSDDGTNKKEAVYNTCVEFVKWYNEEKN